MTSGDDTYLRRHPEAALRGEANFMAKLTDADVVEIRRLYATGLFSYYTLAPKFGITPTNCWRIVNRKLWAHLPSPEISILRPKSKLTEANVIEIRALHASGGFTHEAIAAKFGVTRSVVTNIVNRKKWTHVP
jgi:DNA invertase Pin-like site-specific DNA recombinase